MLIDFIKSHGTGNDFVLIPDLDNTFSLSAGSARLLCDRHFGIGADAVIRIGTRFDDHGKALFSMDYLNSDGSYSEMCGNGLRVIGKWLGDNGHAGDEVDVATDSGVKTLGLHRGTDGVQSITVDMGVPFFADDITETLVIDGEQFTFSFVSMGNPHAVMVVDNVDAAPLAYVASKLQAYRPRFPNGVNVGVVEAPTGGVTRQRTYERGAGETLACGSNACAAAVAMQRQGLAGETVDIDVRGGRLRLEWKPGGSVLMTGPAVEVYRGQFEAQTFGLQGS